MLITLLSFAALAEEPGPFAEVSSFEGSYTLTIDMPAAADSVCSVTGYCDCSSTYTAQGKKVGETPDSVTFQGSWKLGDSDCHALFKGLLWAGPEAYHTVKLADDGITEWVAHRDKENTTKVTEGSKAAGQFWIDDLGLAWSKGTPATTTQSDTSDLGQGIVVTNNHTVRITLR